MNTFWRFTISKAMREPKTLALAPFELVKADIHRQFTGLGLIEEVFESGSWVDPIDNRKSIPFSRQVWRLTRQGQEYMALIRGFRRPGSSPSGT